MLKLKLKIWNMVLSCHKSLEGIKTNSLHHLTLISIYSNRETRGNFRELLRINKKCCAVLQFRSFIFSRTLVFLKEKFLYYKNNIPKL